MKVLDYSVPFVVGLLQNMDKISEKRYYKADLSASDLLLDLELIVRKANLTDKQFYILTHYWIEGYTQEEVAQNLGITQQMVEKHTRAIKKKIHKILIDMGENIDDIKK